MVDLRAEGDRGWFEGVPGGKSELDEELSALVW